MKKQLNEGGHTHDHLTQLLSEHNIKIKFHENDNHITQAQEKVSYCPLFKGLSQTEHDQFLDRNVKDILTFKKGETIVMQGEYINYVLLLVHGSIRTEMITSEGNLLEIDILEAVIPLAPYFIYGIENKYPFDIIALETCVILKISKSSWLNEMSNNRQLLTNFLSLNADLTLYLTKKLQMISLRSLRKKFATFLIEKTSIEKNSFTLKRSRSQLADFFGVQRQSLARSLKEMEDDGIIKLEGRKVTILDRGKLIRE